MATPSTISSENACQNCDKPATRICGSCKDAPVLASEQIQAIYYCSESCESTHYPHHKELCEKLRMRRTLFRAADTIQQAFLILREQCYEKIISSVTTNGIVTNLNEMWPSTDQINSRFPNELFTNARDRAAVLTFNSCVDGVAHTYELVKAALRDITKSIREISVDIANPIRRLTAHGVLPEEADSKSHPPTHIILSVKLLSGEHFTLDFGGAQFGFYTPCEPLRDYLLKYKAKVLKQYTHGTFRHELMASAREGVAEEGAGADRMAMLWALDGHYSLAMDEVLAAWEERSGLKEGLSEMLRLPQEEYLVRREELMTAVRGALARKRAEMVARRWIRIGAESGTFMTDESWRLMAEIPDRFARTGALDF